MGRDTLNGFTGRIAHLLAENIVCGDDGFYCYWPKHNERKGALMQHHVYWLYCLLAWLNEPWEKEIEKIAYGYQ